MPRVDTDGSSNDDEQTPLLNGAAIPRKPSDDATAIAVESDSSRVNLTLILPALMLCAFLAAFDVTVVAAIYPIMYTPYKT
jgi:hypothetical protein